MKLSSGTKCRCTLGELIECFDNKRIPLSAQERATRKGPYRYYGAQNVVDHIDAYLFDGEYALIAEDGENLRSQKQDVAQIVEGQFWVNNHAHIIQANANADLWYLCALLNQTDISRYISGSAQPKLSQEGMRKIVVEVPDVQEQRRIGLLLRSLDRKIALNRKKIATLEKMAKEIYDYWFVQYDFPDANGRPYKSSGGEMVYSPELKREIPKGWRVDVLSSFCEVVNGATPSTSTMGNYGGNIVWITPKDLSDQGQKFIACGERCITKLGYESCSTHMIPKGSLLMSSRAPIGLLAMAACELCTNQGFKNLVPNDMSDRFYLYYYLQSHMSQIEQLGSGTTFKEVSREAISKYPILYVTDQMVRKCWVDFISPIFGRQMVLQDEIDRLIALRDFLLPLLMNGQVKVGE